MFNQVVRIVELTKLSPAKNLPATSGSAAADSVAMASPGSFKSFEMTLDEDEMLLDPIFIDTETITSREDAGSTILALNTTAHRDLNQVSEVNDRSNFAEQATPAATIDPRVLTLQSSGLTHTITTSSSILKYRNKRTRRSQVTQPRKWLSAHIVEDEERCKCYGVPNLWTSQKVYSIQSEIGRLSAKHQDLFLKLWFSICSANSVVALQDAIKALRDDIQVEFMSPTDDLTAKARFELIEMVEDKAASLTLLRRCHILKLWEENQTLGGGNDNWNVFDGSRACSNAATKRPGNPRNIQNSQATHTLMSRMFPGMQRGTASYEEKYRKMKRLRKLGERLNGFCARFGLGILGLLPFSELQLTKFSMFTLSDAS